MRVLIAGASGVIGRRLSRLLVERGHEVFGTTREQRKVAELESLGARVVICDALDTGAVRRVIEEVRPEAIVNQLTALSAPLNPRKYAEWIVPTNRLRTEGTRNLVHAGVAAGTRLLLSQSIAFAYRWDSEGEGEYKTEDDLLFDDSVKGAAEAVGAIRDLERQTLHTPELEGIVLRYGFFYGPGTSYARDGDIADQVRKRRFPVIGDGTGRSPFIHIDDAARATVAALEHGQPGVFNIVDNEPAEFREWVPLLARTIGAGKPRHVPLWLARLVAGSFLAESAVRMPPVSNEKARRELSWEPSISSWREGFVSANG